MLAIKCRRLNKLCWLLANNWLISYSLACALAVDDGAIMDTKFCRFYNEPPNGFEEIMIEKSLL